jgi:hypothetical protein
VLPDAFPAAYRVTTSLRRSFFAILLFFAIRRALPGRGSGPRAASILIASTVLIAFVLSRSRTCRPSLGSQ